MDQTKLNSLINNDGFKPQLSRYPRENRKWFVNKLLDHYKILNPQITDNELIQKITDAITTATKTVDERIGQGVVSTRFIAKWPANQKNRIQIIYDTLAMYPEFLDQRYHSYRDFIIERRFQMLKRMNCSVNFGGIFDYPPAGATAELNGYASYYWDTDPADLFCILKPTGIATPAKAVSSIFKENVGDVNPAPSGDTLNLFDCALAMASLHLGSLLEAKDPAALLAHLISEGNCYLSLGHPYRSAGNILACITTENVSSGPATKVKVGKPWFIAKSLDKQPNGKLQCMILYDENYEFIEVAQVQNDTLMINGLSHPSNFPSGSRIYIKDKANAQPPYDLINDMRQKKALFEFVTVPLQDLQVGDHVYIANHPLYEIFFKGGAWVGEHAIVEEIKSRDLVDLFKIQVAGHGVEVTSLFDMAYQRMMGEIAQELEAISYIVFNHLKYFKTNGAASSSSGDVVVSEDLQTKIDTFKYDPSPYTYGNMVNGFTIRQETVGTQGHLKAFFIDKKIQGEQKVITISFIDEDANLADYYGMMNWGIIFISNKTGEKDSFRFVDKSINLSNFDIDIANKLMYEDLVKSGIIENKLNRSDGYVSVIRPRVSFDPDYLKYLSDIIKAIEPIVI